MFGAVARFFSGQALTFNEVSFRQQHSGVGGLDGIKAPAIVYSG